ncbi:branched-chain amino acid ABC transporter, substrate-binding protein [Deferribacter desulfuricans SSM1]|uniref:Branched-chain amino acid ABC transporter, substrate-binding protein n=1 Tax=Deferribacter desulfuricans (strain DSM 14783 / JCM 11476 / NBRC 101012 / SSM1) TaxID=639282 RepID=D3PDC4_DEFDS|nr:ABC transporter substrate-binding protein [Deferribacter desulfuricans]BAI80597.1 branched-chain amino acid ABC transporter, substrate-binding protein [Deferribacter desulfuricans SSM1]
MLRIILSVFLTVFISITAFAEIKIGALLAISGPASHIGKPAEVILKELVKQHNQTHKEKIRLIIYDTKSQPKMAIQYAKKLIKKNRVDVIIGPNTTGSALAIIPVVQKAKVVTMTLVGGTSVVEPVKKYVFKSPQKTSTAIKKIKDYLLNNKITKIGVIADSGGFGQDGIKSLKKLSNGLEIVGIEKFNKSDANMTSQLSKLLNKKPQAILAWTVGSAGAKIAKNLRHLNQNILLIQSHGLADYYYIKLAGTSAEGSILPATKFIVADQLPDSDPQKLLLIEFNQKFGKLIKDSSVHAVYAYDAFMLIMKGFEISKAKNIPLVDALEQIKNFISVTGVYNLSKQDHCGLDEDSMVIIKVENGKFKLVER